MLQTTQTLPGEPLVNNASEAVGTVDVALTHAVRLLATRPALAAQQASEILQVAPSHPQALLLLGMAQRRCGDGAAALKILQLLCGQQPHWATARYELGVALGDMRQADAAVNSLRRAVELDPEMSSAWLALADHLGIVGDIAAAEAAYARYISASTKDPRLLAAGAALYENKIPLAEALLREHLKQFPTDVAAIRMFAEVAVRLGRLQDAEDLLNRCLELAPGFAGARHNYASVLYRRNKTTEALREVALLLATDPHNPGHRNLKAAVLTRIGEYDQAIDLYAGVLADYPNQARVWLNYGHALKTAGREAECIQAYRKCIGLAPGSGEAYWSLANLKTYRFTDAEVEAMNAQLCRVQLSDEDRFHFHFAIGKSLEDASAFCESFEHYTRGNRLRRSLLVYDADETTALVRRSKALLTRQFFEDRRAFGLPARDPIFIVGLPRAGSTLVEQILSSHSQVEGTMELPDLIQLAKELRPGNVAEPAPKYPGALAHLSAAQSAELGARYLRQTRIQRKTDAPFFIDKMPNNFVHVGLIHLVLPGARIIDVRRHPLGCCFSVFKQHFARGQAFAYSLDDIGRYYRDYVELMAHFDEVLPGRVYRVNYESLVQDTETEVRRLLEHCGLPFEEHCLRYYMNERAVRTASSQQVRQPIFRDGIEQWCHYESWLEPLKRALGPALEAELGTPQL
jgi:tetratricopeptide (TPR) repeat protein